MPPAARLGDKTSHGGSIGPPAQPALALKVASVLIEGKPAAVLGGSVHVCPKVPDPLLGPSNLLVPKGPPRLVLIGDRPAAAVGDRAVCQASVVLGARTVFYGGML
ncbi:PAAR domain-containing protein [Saccharothrix algeriensis]|uniref:PAAR domain-containing protein n=1 Tax=Saccharothrix algeriensis TaxID=173560 RepID=A0A8T8HZX3_9PSEU|nr:PAAR domain-containing protein [Saccharothrix algeriensis]MBM7815035.1 putative Zn-binding protein involved in type VI secretion [Saccharothrix algeriensis]QTR03284.1 PAAR domain-containing protein [Saccharothrix algeriensis]